jgi:hypothetical protein
MTDPVSAPLADDFHAALVARINAICQGPLKLHCARMPDGHVELPHGASLTLRFTIAELRAIGVTVQIIDPDGHLLTDDQYVDMLVAADTAAAGVPTPAATPITIKPVP